MADPNAPSGTAGDRPEPVEIEALAARLGIDLPPECVPGVRYHSRLLDQHWANLQASGLPPA